jgi:hypothetical protein
LGFGPGAPPDFLSTWSDEGMTEDTQGQTWSVAEVERQRVKAEELAARVEELKARESDLARAIAEGLADGQDVAGLQEQRREAGALRADISSALPVLAERIAERREQALRREASARLLAISRAHGSRRSSYEGDLARIAAKAGELVEAIGKANGRYDDLQVLETEVLVLLDRFDGLSEPAITRVHPPALQDRAVEAVRKVGAAVLSKPANLPRRLLSASEREVKALKARIADSPSGEILEAAGPLAEDHRTRRDRAMRESRDRQDAARLAEMDRLDGWLRDHLTSGPVPAAAVKEAAEREGIAVRGGGDGLSLHDAAGRVGVVALARKGEGDGRWWHIGRTPEGFDLPRERLRMHR